MKRTLSVFLFATFCFGILQTAVGQTATQDVTINVPQIAVIGVSGGGLTFDFSNNDVTEGTATAALTETRSYALFTNITGAGVKVTGKLDGGYSSGIDLKVNLDAPSAGGTSAGTHSLTTTETNLVESIPPTAEGGININYTAEITPSAEPNSGSTQTVTYTVTAQ